MVSRLAPGAASVGGIVSREEAGASEFGFLFWVICPHLVVGTDRLNESESVYEDFLMIALTRKRTGRPARLAGKKTLRLRSSLSFRDNVEMTRAREFLLSCLFAAAILAGPACELRGQTEQIEKTEQTTFSRQDLEFFESRIRPVLVKHCFECHSSGSSKLQGGLLVDFRGGLEKGGESGPAIVPGKPEKSLLLQALRHESFEMPPSGKLPDTVIADFEKWIRNGAADPRDKAPTAAEAADESWKIQLAERSQWWSLQPPRVVSPPTVADKTWSKEPVDRFVRAALDEAGLAPAATADAEVLLRRLSFVLTGLPPNPARVKSFPIEFAKSPDEALKTLVNELLASPHFGERFARHWMDVVRYTDTYGYEWDNPAKGSWEYRDYLIRAFNDDVGFDQLIREQIAGDLLPPRINAQAGVNESLIGPMFYHMGEHRHGSSLDFNGIHQDMLNNKIDAFSKAFLATTVACARCHDHKLDAVSQADYYALAGVFMSPRWTSRVIDAPGKHDASLSELKQLRREIQAALNEHWRTDDPGFATSVRDWAAKNAETLKTAKLEQVSFPLAQIAGATDETIAATWTKLAADWRTAREARLKSNKEQFTAVSDFSQPGFPDAWTVEGDGIAQGFVDHGTPRVSLKGEGLIEEFLPRGYHTHALSSKLPGAIRLPPQSDVPGQFVSLQLAGGEWAGWLIVPQNAFQSEGVKYFEPTPATQWVSISDSGLTNGVTRVLTEVMTSSLNPNFPPRTGLARAGSVKLPDNDDGFDKRSWFSVTGIVTHDGGGIPQDTLDQFVPLFELDPPTTVDDAWRRIAEWLAGTTLRWAGGSSTAGDVPVLNWMLTQKLLSNEQNSAPSIATLVNRYRETESQIAFPRTANSMDEHRVAPLDYRLNIRGDPDRDGPVIPRDFLTVFAGQNDVAESAGSGRLELARYLASRDNPQTARVYVNRVWYWVFGRGIVGTPSDFGTLGERPSHPDLLDWLARKFVEEGWSTKTLIRRLVLSKAFRQSGAVSQAASDLDPDNRLLHHYPTRRLEAEAIRDNLLAVSGRLDPQLFGRPINPPRPAEDGSKRLYSGPLDSNGRRSLYMKMSIMEPPKFLVCFNLPDLKLPTGQRDITNDPAQALAMLNNPLVVQLASHWAAELVKDGHSSPADRVREMFVLALGRPPSDSELLRWTVAVGEFSQADDPMMDQTAWEELAHALFNTKEFIYYR